uniref:3(S)-hydroxy-(+)-manool synthase n=1 Tax=Callicarpa americana TaxID=204211 RepID=A0A977Q817_CALAM|nr:3(S)-hydroxy-(+)-manool synthase [Callicarpa americana]
MEFEPPSTLIVALSFLLFMLMVVKSLRKATSNYSWVHLNLIPGPKKLPLTGNLHLLVGNSPLHHAFRDLAVKYGPLMHLQLGEVPFLIVSSVEVAKQVLKTHDVTFANRPPGLAAMVITYNYANIGLAPYGEHWRHLRKICTLELLSVRRVQSFRPIREEENLNLAKWIASNAGSPANLSERVYLSSFDITTRASIGKSTEEKGTITSAIKEVMKLGSGFTIADLYPSIRLLPLISGIKFKIERIFRQTDRILDSIINEHRVTKATKTDDAMERSEDLADVLLKYQEDEAEVRLTTDNIKAVVMDMFLAGGETSATAVDWAMSEMIKNPTTLKRAQEEVRQVFDGKGYVDEAEFQELVYLKLVIRETLRLHPPLPLLVPRQNSQRCEISGYEIPEKTRVIINAWALGRDHKYWNDADKFIPERFVDSSIDYKGNNLEYIPFGAGRRMCPGISFGLANVEFTLAMLLYHFDWEMPNGIKNEELDMAEALGPLLKENKIWF